MAEQQPTTTAGKGPLANSPKENRQRRMRELHQRLADRGSSQGSQGKPGGSSAITKGD